MYLWCSGCSHPLCSLLSPSHPCQPSPPFMSFCFVVRPLIQTKVFCRSIGWELAIMANGLSVRYTIKHNGCPSSGTHQYPVVHLGGEELHKPLPPAPSMTALNRPSAGSCSCDIVLVMAMSCPEDSISQTFSLFSGSYVLSNPSAIMCHDP